MYGISKQNVGWAKSTFVNKMGRIEDFSTGLTYGGTIGWGTRSIGAEFEFGTVIFVDAGNVWKEEDDMDLVDLNWSAGIGLRIGLENMPSSPTLRIDYGWALGDSSGSEVTVGLEQLF